MEASVAGVGIFICGCAWRIAIQKVNMEQKCTRWYNWYRIETAECIRKILNGTDTEKGFIEDVQLGTAQVVLLGSEGLPEGAVLSLKSGLAAFKMLSNCQRFANSQRFFREKLQVGWHEASSAGGNLMISDLCGMIGERVWPPSGFGSCNRIFFSLIEIAFSTWWFHQKLSRCFQMCKKIPSLRLNIKSLRGERWNHRPLRSPKQGNTFASTTLPRIQCRWRQLGSIVYIVLADDV